MVSSASIACSRCSILARRSGSDRTFVLISFQGLCPLMVIFLPYVALPDTHHRAHLLEECICHTTVATDSSYRLQSGEWRPVGGQKRTRYVCWLLEVEAPSYSRGVIF